MRSQKCTMRGCFGDLGAHPLFAKDWRLENNASSLNKHGGPGAEPPALKNFVGNFFGKNNWILGLYFDKN